jgi:hypothetical protein
MKEGRTKNIALKTSDLIRSSNQDGSIFSSLSKEFLRGIILIEREL